MHMAFFIKVIYGIQIYFIPFFLQSYFSDEQNKFLIVQFYWNKKFKHRFIYERILK